MLTSRHADGGAMRINSASLIFLFSACSSEPGHPSDPTVDAAVDTAADIDASPDAPSSVPAMIAVSGTATQRTVGGTALAANVAIAAYRSTDETTALTSTTTAADGTYGLTLPTDHMPIDGFLEATKASDITTYLYPSAPLSADMANASI